MIGDSAASPAISWSGFQFNVAAVVGLSDCRSLSVTRSWDFLEAWLASKSRAGAGEEMRSCSIARPPGETFG
jgi:hypothetical protein